ALELEEVAATEDAGVGQSNAHSDAQANEEDDTVCRGRILMTVLLFDLWCNFFFLSLLIWIFIAPEFAFGL
ncbi:hypothetical protein A2U01_0083864, partial [Trifolium medium]|nr:hypothetical protein [Trifolium medium]